MKIKVGGRYVARNGEIVSIVRQVERGHYPFEARNGLCFTKDGFYYSPAYASDHDLMHEFKDYGAPGGNSFWWWACGIALLVVLVMLVMHWGPVVFPGG